MNPTNFLDVLHQRPLLCDGAMGTQLIARGLRPGVCGETWNLENPGAVEDIHRAYRSAGCDHCEYQGYKGRIAIMVMLRLDNDLDDLISRRATQREIRHMARDKGFRPLSDDGLRRVLDGSTSIEEVGRVIDLTERM